MQRLVACRYYLHINKTNMKQNVTESQFIEDVTGDEYNNMSYYGAKALYNYLVQLEDDCGIEIEHDIVAIRCDYSEYNNALEYANEFSDFKTEHYQSELSEDDNEQLALEYLENNTQVIPAYDALRTLKSYVIQSF